MKRLDLGSRVDEIKCSSCGIDMALIDMEIRYEEFMTIMKEKNKYEMMKENVRNVSEKLEEKTKNMRLNSVNSRKQIV